MVFWDIMGKCLDKTSNPVCGSSRVAGGFDSHALPPVYLTIGSSENLSHMVTEKSVEKTLKMESVRSLSKLFWHRP